MTRIRFEWNQWIENPDLTGSMRYIPGPDRSREVEWPSVPRVGEHVEPDKTGVGYTVKVVMWRADGSAVVRLR